MHSKEIRWLQETVGEDNMEMMLFTGMKNRYGFKRWGEYSWYE